MQKGESIPGLLIGVAAGFATLIVGWNGWLSTVVFEDHANISQITQSLSDVRDTTTDLRLTLNQQVIPTLNRMAVRQGVRIASTTNDETLTSN